MYTTAPLFGRFHSTVKATRQTLVRQPLHHLESLCAQRFDPALLEPNARQTNSRQRLFTPKLSFLAFLDQILNPDASCRRALDQLKAYYQTQPHSPPIAHSTSGYCQARARWAADELSEIRRQIAARQALHGDTFLPGVPGQRTVKLVDGSCLNLADTPANRMAYPQATSQKPGCGFPLVRLVGVFCLKTGMLLEETTAPYTTSENALFQKLWPTFAAGDIILADRNFCSYGSLASLQQQGVDGLFRVHASRQVDFRCGVRAGSLDRWITWVKPRNRPANLTPEQWAALPATLTVRVVRFRLPTGQGRCQEITLVTTLTDAALWPVKLLAALYARRWKIELYFDDLKTTLKMDHLSCRTPAMVQKELQMHFLAYNLIRALMGEAALTANVPLDRISFKGTLDAATQYSLAMAKIPAAYKGRRATLYQAMLATIAGQPVPERPGRREPRCQKRRPKSYPFLTRPRAQMKDVLKNCRKAKS